MQRSLLEREIDALWLSKSIQDRSRRIYAVMEDDILRPKYPEVTSNHLSSEVVEQLERVKRLMNLPHPDALRLAMECVFVVVDCSNCAGEDKFIGETDRPSDEMADELMCRILKRRVKAGHHENSWDASATIERLKKTRIYIMDDEWKVFLESPQYLRTLVEPSHS